VGLAAYQHKRHFARTREPAGRVAPTPALALLTALLPSPFLPSACRSVHSKGEEKAKHPDRVNLYTGCGSSPIRPVQELYSVGADP
jgi:hypothetical protein